MFTAALQQRSPLPIPKLQRSRRDPSRIGPSIFPLKPRKSLAEKTSAESNEDTPCAVLTPQLRSGLAATLLEAVLYPLEETSPMSRFVDRMHATNLIIDAARFPEEARPDEQSGEETEEESGITISFGKDFSAALFRCSVPFLKAFPIVF